jgi:glycosyltransferase involved in cell wall biosynthesis
MEDTNMQSFPGLGVMPSRRISQVESQLTPRRQRPERPRILFFSQNACWPLDTGAKLRNYYLLRALARNWHVTWLGFSDHCPDPAQSAAVRSEPRNGTKSRSVNPLVKLASVCAQVTAVERPQGFSPAKLVRGVVGATPVTVLKYTTPEMAETLRRVLDEEDFDVVQVESLVLASYLPIIRAARHRPVMICDWHNVESEVLARYSDQSPNLLKRLYARKTAWNMAALERDSLPAFDAHLVVSERDREQLLAWQPDARIFVVENGVDIEHYSDGEIARAWRDSQGYSAERRSGGAAPSPAAPPRNRVLFVGSMDYHANIDAVICFAREVWPSVHARWPGLIFTIVGRKPAPEVSALADLPGIEVTGTVEDVRPYYREAAACVVPLRIGGGSRLKILEAMAAGVPVVSTWLGAEGLAVNDGEHLLLADTVDQLGYKLLELLDNDVLRQRLRDADRACVRKRYDWSAIGEMLCGAHRQLLDEVGGLDAYGTNEALIG